MKRILIGCCVLAAGGPAPAQKPAADRAAMYEDVEVMRRLLADAVGRAKGQAYASWAGPLYVDPIGSTSRPNWNTNLLTTGGLIQGREVVWTPQLQPYVTMDSRTGAAQQMGYALWDFDRGGLPPATDGTYLKGVGPVFTVTLDQADVAGLTPPQKGPALAANCAQCHGTAMAAKVQAATAPKAAPVDAWDQALRQVRGEPAAAAPVAPAARLTPEEICGPGRLSELALDALAKYGPRFRDVGPDERLTVVFTVRPAPKEAPAVAEDAGVAARKKAEEKVAEGDLHAKQGTRAEAAQAYRAAIDFLSRPLAFGSDTPAEQVRAATEEATNVLRKAHGRLAQTLILDSAQLVAAKAAIDAAESAAVKTQLVPRPAPPPEKPPLPIKLTVAVGKKALDDHKAGKLDVAGLRGAADLEAVGFPSPKAKK